jgi:hypothetical protein
VNPAPKSVQGQVIGIFVMLFGIGFLSLLTATVASHFVEVDKTTETERMLAALERIERTGNHEGTALTCSPPVLSG